MASSAMPSLMKDEQQRNWAELPSELTSSILLRLGAIDILDNAQKVCTSWRRVSKDPSMWRKIDMHYDFGEYWRIRNYDLEIMCRHAVDRSQGALVEIDISYFCTDNLLNYIADSASNLKSLRLANCNRITDEGVVEAVAKLPLLEDLDVSYSRVFSEKSICLVGLSCPYLKTLKLKRSGTGIKFFDIECDDIVMAIAESMPELRQLQLLWNNGLTNRGLNAIFDGCPHLEHLDLRKCYNINLVGDIEKRCSERIRALRHLDDSTAEYPSVSTIRLLEYHCDSDDDHDYIYGHVDHDVDDEFSCPSPSDYEWDF